MESKILIRTLRKEDLGLMIELFNFSRVKKTSFDYIKNPNYNPELVFKKKYDQKQINLLPLGTGAFLGNKLIGMCLVTYYKLKNTSKEFTVGQLGDVVIKREFQSKGLFNKLLHAIMNEAEKLKIDGLIGFPNLNATPAFKNNHKWIHVGDFCKYEFSLKTFPILKILNKLGFYKLFYRLIKSVNKLKFKSVETKVLTVPLSKEYLDYKSYHDYRIFETQVSNILWTISDGVNVVNSTIYNEDLLKIELNELRKYFSRRGVHKLSYIVQFESNLSSYLSRWAVGTKTVPIFIFYINNDIKKFSIIFSGFERNHF